MANPFPNLKSYSKEELLSQTSCRPGETKLGEVLDLPLHDDIEEALTNSSARFVLLGIKEDIGIRANLGHGGASECWDTSLKALLNLQSNQFLKGEEILLLGRLEFPELMAAAAGLKPTNSEDLQQLRELTAGVDKAVSHLVKAIIKAAKVPILIGGGHNNSYGNLRGCSEALAEAIACLNIDPHADFRNLEGRHSGNGFSYARQEGYLGRYAIYGLQQGYNSEAMLQKLDEDPAISYRTFESLLSLEQEKQRWDFINLLNWCGLNPLGLELDLDALTAFPVSALNPSGFTLNEVRWMVSATAALRAPRYFHLCEGSPLQAGSEAERQLMAKSLAFLVTDFIKAYPKISRSN